jgi:type II secretory pathway pseudopilin PulG
MKRRTRCTVGFTLLETILALVIFSSIVVALQRGTALGLRGVRIATLNETALQSARMKLAAAGIETELRDGLEEHGAEGRFTWHLRAQKYQAPQAVPVSRLEGYWVEVTVAWAELPFGSERTIRLKTLKLGKS